MIARSERSILSRMIKNQKKAFRDPITPLLELYFIKRDKSEERLEEYRVPLKERDRLPGRLSPSGLCGCERQAVYKFLGTPGRKHLEDPTRQLIFENGNWVHHRWQALFMDMEKVLGSDIIKVVAVEEHVSYPELYIDGHLDVHLIIKGTRMIIDIKSINQVGFDALTRNKEPNPTHKNQVIAYCKARNVTRGILWYECKDNQELQAYLVHYDDEAWEEVVAWCERVLRSMKRKRLPAMHPECLAGNYLFERCPWAKLCYGGEDLEDLEDRVYVDFPGVRRQWERYQAS